MSEPNAMAEDRRELSNLRNERDEMRIWIVEMAEALDVDARVSNPTTVCEAYRVVRDRILTKARAGLRTEDAAAGAGTGASLLTQIIPEGAGERQATNL